MKCPFCPTSQPGDRLAARRTAGHPPAPRVPGVRPAVHHLRAGRGDQPPVVKKDGRREAFDREKIARGAAQAPARSGRSRRAARGAGHRGRAAAPGAGREGGPLLVIGELVMERLHELDEVAYVRFASVYRSFRTSTSSWSELAEGRPARRPAAVSAPAGPAERFMRLALDEATRGAGAHQPQPGRRRGAGEGRPGGRARLPRPRRGPHAEVVALRTPARGPAAPTSTSPSSPATTPGATPPCTEAVLAAGVRRVSRGSARPNPLVNGRGIRRLRRAGVAGRRACSRPSATRSTRPAPLHPHRAPLRDLEVAATLDGGSPPRPATRGG